jgi:choline dehydrogenase-like flavoprotein
LSDVIVIGGGATGLGTALELAARGYRTLLLEQHDFAKATSSRSTKLDTRRNPPDGCGGSRPGALSVDLPPDRTDPGACRFVSGDFGRTHPLAARRSWKISRSML